MWQLIALFLTALTLPIWGGALAAVVGAGFYLAFQHPLILLLIVGGLLFLGTKVG